MPYARCRAVLRQYMYNDTVTISRQVPIKDGEGADDYDVQTVYADVPCKLSQYGKALQSEERPREFWLQTDLRVCMAPEYDVQPNDILTITHDRTTFVLNAARSFLYPTHQEISVRREDEA